MPRQKNLGVILLIAVSAFLSISFVLAFRGQPQGTRHPDFAPSYQGPVNIDPSLLHGEATAPKLENATLKYVCPV
jgi:FAD-linked sulfhydryl oxidase